MSNETYNYSAVLVNKATETQPSEWMVKRWQSDPDDYTEALISLATEDPETAIEAAIKRGSWA